MHRSAKRSALIPNFSFDFQIKPYLLILKKLNTFEPSLNVINIDTHTMQNVFSFYPSDIWTEFEKMYREYSLVWRKIWNLFHEWDWIFGNFTSPNPVSQVKWIPYSTSKTFSIAIFSWFFNMFLWNHKHCLQFMMWRHNRLLFHIG